MGSLKDMLQARSTTAQPEPEGSEGTLSIAQGEALLEAIEAFANSVKVRNGAVEVDDAEAFVRWANSPRMRNAEYGEGITGSDLADAVEAAGVTSLEDVEIADDDDVPAPAKPARKAAGKGKATKPATTTQKRSVTVSEYTRQKGRKAGTRGCAIYLEGHLLPEVEQLLVNAGITVKRPSNGS